MMNLKLNTITRKILLPTTAVLLGATIAVTSYITSKSESSAVAVAVSQAEDLVDQYRAVRAYYTENVVKKINAVNATRDTGIKASFDHKGKSGMIPLPATMIHDLSEGMGSNGTKLRLYSEFPFPNRKDRTIDAFGKTALSAFQSAPDKPVTRYEVLDGKRVVRVAIADKMGEACVGCHNNHSDSPKKDWKVGDVRGVLEAIVPVQESVDAAAAVARGTGIALFGAAGIVIAVLWLTLRRVNARLDRTVVVLEQVAAGDLVQHIDDNAKDEVGRTGAALNLAVKGMQMALCDVRNAADEAAAAARELSATANSMSADAEEQAAAAEQSSASLALLASGIRANSDSARQVQQLAATTKDAAQVSANLMKKTVEAMGVIGRSSVKVSDVVSSIDEFAFRTNLLAINASVEAARAGEQGKGFAVVAQEVRNLAQRSAEAAKEIRSLIDESRRSVTAGTHLVEESGSSFRKILQSIEKLAREVSEIASASNQQAQQVDQITLASRHTDQVTQGNAAKAEELSATAGAMAGQAESLLTLVGRFRLDQLSRREPTSAEPTHEASDGPSLALVPVPRTNAQHPGFVPPPDAETSSTSRTTSFYG